MSTDRPDLQIVGTAGDGQTSAEPVVSVRTTLGSPVPPAGALAPRVSARLPRDRTLLAVAALAATRIGVGWVFLWAFLDKLVGFGYPTPASGGWLDGASPTDGFLSSVAVGPFQEFFHSIAGAWWVDVLFMAALAGIGVGLVLGIALRPVAVAGTLLVLSIWCTRCPWVIEDVHGHATDSANPFFDIHLLYALLFVLFAATRAGDFGGLGRQWSRLPVVRSNRWLW